ncbi:MAG TPA: aldo/keto reductase, partial [Stellaceae bacterium]|nr:aldo/keto reductase [Stellaceae bacterium]
MDYTTLGRTGLKVSVAGLGCGGFSRLGLGTGGGDDGAIAIVRQAIDLGVNLFDTAAAYGTEEVLGKAIAGRRDGLVICTKAPFSWSSGQADPAGIVDSLDASLRRL